MKQTLIILALFLTQCMWAQDKSLQDRADELAEGTVFGHACIGLKVMKGSETLASINENRLLIPASNMKLVSTGAALYHFGADHRFATSISYDGSIEDGVLRGNLYICGGADPTLGSKDSIAVVLDKVFAQWEKSIRQAGIKEIDGYIIGDGRWLEGMAEEPSWLWSDIGAYYGSGISGLTFYENMISFNASVDCSQKPERVRLSQQYPSTSWMTITQACTVGEKSTGDRLYMYTSDLAPTAEIRGTYGIDRGRKRVDFSNKFPEYTCAVYFKNYLDKKGIPCSKGAADFKLKTEWLEGKTPSEGIGSDGDSLKFITTTLSPTLERITFTTNHASNNIYAETLFRALGKDIYGNSDYGASRKAMNETLKNMGLDSALISGIRIQDGSGLSRQNYVSTDFFCKFLRAMMDTPYFVNYLLTLPIPGGKGSLIYNMRAYPEDLRSRIRVKSGSMNGTRCYSGYILPTGYVPVPGKEIPKEIKDEIIIFSIMTNNCVSSSSEVRRVLDKFMAEMTAF